MTSLLTSELKIYQDTRTKRTVRQLTDYKGHSHHLYFTNPGWFDQNRRLLFGSDRLGRTNLFSVELATGAITQHTNLDMPGPPRETSFLYTSVNPLRAEAYFWRGNDLIAVDLQTNRERLLYKADPRYIPNMTSVTADGKAVCSVIYQDLSDTFKVDLLAGYVGFEEYWGALPDSRIVVVPVDGGPAQEVWQENYWIGHVNASPTLPNILTFCHEGPWHKVDNRIWGLDINTGLTWQIRHPHTGEKVGHEYWHADGVYIGYHGEYPDGKKFFGRVRYDNSDNFEVSFPFHTGHIHSNSFEMIVGDGMGDREQPVIRLWRWNGEQFEGPRVLCEHRGSFQIQRVHVHPRFSLDGTKVVFTSDMTGYGNVYEVEVGNFEDLPLLGESMGYS